MAVSSRHSSSKRTADFINQVLTRITLVGALYLIVVSFIPEWMITNSLNHLFQPLGGFFEKLPNWVTNGLGVNFILAALRC
jgi:preprotein translocase subunit SecY